jgi:hypothetical protein
VENTRQSKMFGSTTTTPIKRSKSPSFNSGEKEKVVAYKPTPLKELKMQ